MKNAEKRTERRETGRLAAWWRGLPMSRRFILRTALFALPAAAVSGLAFVAILVDDKTVGIWLAGLGLGLAAGVLALIFAGYAAVAMYVRPLERLELFSRKMVVHDFSEDVEIGERSELLPISQALNKMLSSMRTLVDEMHAVSQEVAGSSGLMASVAKETSDAVQSTASTVSNLAHGAEDQVNSMMIASSTISQMAEEIDRVAEAAREVAKYSLEARVTVEDGGNAVSNAVDKMGRLVETTRSSSVAVRDLGERSEQIGLIVDVITGIADQTNLLALNAAIEAARAGEHGKGFAVVAEEVRKLAEESARAANRIAGIIREIQRTISDTVVLMENSSQEADEGASVVGNAGTALSRIKDAVETIGAETHAISQATDSIAEGSNKVVEIISTVASISEESASSTEEVSASIEEQTASMEQISAAAAELAETADRLRALIEGIRTH
ncbi:MAG: methyl-accepting chemotaxis protein [Actinobacteria bacterium]|nr:methyl-accepting chemotaxis protein [Actinomycetota bacterium]MBU1943582.1 methyl-accepting chemotaxis protein [Actinomycetota bacterium]MBU2688916.1 methyl-accepting chemotaxis protein [Actinomycetota bacterium]